MFKKFLSGIVFGAGFAVAFIIVSVIYFQFFLPSQIERRMTTSSEEVVGAPPAIKEQQEFFGSEAVYSGVYVGQRDVLSAGAGEIVGKAMLNNSPVSGLKLRLALNRSVVSQWATTDAEGIYVVSVPYAEYQIDGYELDMPSANIVLAGKIGHPHDAHSSGKFEVSENNKGRGPTFKFVDPIEKKIPKKQFSISEKVIVNWAQYPGASQYKIQVYEKPDPYAHHIGKNEVFEWTEQPTVSGTSFNFEEHGVVPKPGYFYVIEIYAEDDKNNIISQTARNHSGYDFEAVE